MTRCHPQRAHCPHCLAVGSQDKLLQPEVKHLERGVQDKLFLVQEQFTWHNV